MASVIGVGVPLVLATVAWKMSLLLLKTFTSNLEQIFTIKKVTHNIKGSNSQCIFVSIMPVFDLAVFH